MDFTGYTILISVLLISIYDFYTLRKMKVTISKCFTGSLITLILSFFGTSFLSVLISMPFENTNFKHENFLIIALILVIIFNFYRINGRKVSKGKIKRKEKFCVSCDYTMFLKKDAFKEICSSLLTTFYFIYTSYKFSPTNYLP